MSSRLINRALPLLLFAALSAIAQLPIDRDLAAEIAKIKAIDNHAHPVKVVLGKDEPDREYDALPVENMEPASDPVRTRPDNPEVIEVWRRLFDYRYHDRTPEHVRELQQRKKQLMEQKGDGYANWVLDQLGIETMFANRVAMGRGIQPPRFRWVPFDDALMYPANNAQLAAQTPDRKLFFAYEDQLLRRYLKDAGYQTPPATLDEYLKRVITPTLEKQRQGGAIAVKFEAAYLRSLDFNNTTMPEAVRIYALAQRSTPDNADYKKLQDYLFRFIAAECGRLGMAVHLHAAAGAGSYFDVSGANPLLLESVLNDPALRKTNFVMLHGGWPFTSEITALLQKQNAYVDFSEQTFFNYPREVSQVIRRWLEYVPEKVMFATDAYPFSEELNWEEAGWMATSTGRQALGLALSDMLRDQEIDRARAVQLARMVLRDNAIKLYHLE